MNTTPRPFAWPGTGMIAVLLLTTVTMSHPAWAQVQPAPMLGSHMVLQRDQPIPIWGTAAPGEAVAVALGDQAQQAVADDDGHWQVEFPARPASAQPVSIVIRGAESSVTLEDVLVGDLWLCSGQSNMQMRVRMAADAQAEAAAADFPLIRHVYVPRAMSETPLDESLQPAEWEVCGPRTTGMFGAVAYYFAREVHQQTGVPIGMIGAAWGGTPIRSWIGRDVLAKYEWGRAFMEEYRIAAADDYAGKRAAYLEARKAHGEAKAAAKAAGEPFTQPAPLRPMGPDHPSAPATLYNGIIHPLPPLRLRGVLWYQGEWDAGRAAAYLDALPALIDQWRTIFGDPTLPFGIVQLPNTGAKDPEALGWTALREVQRRVAARDPHVGLATTIDIGGQLHPLNKQDVGKRLALWALAKIYGREVVWSGPAFNTMQVTGDSVRVQFDHADGLATRDGAAPALFELAGADGVFHPADATIDGDAVVVTSPQVPQPTAVRYAWRANPPCNLINAAGLPAVPFTTVESFLDAPPVPAPAAAPPQ